ncbi:Dabb family protein [Tundrisphaera lichenicola]|uniref:Dabb family protein n=1 Tax=Tundrisphaera lichenicola TaxID=2029860 RepID=UPI003EBCA33E
MNVPHPGHLVTFGLVALLAGVVIPAAEAAEPMLAHSVMFTLKDRSPESRAKFVEACEKYLSNHPGVTSFSVGTIAEDVVEPVSDREFDVALLVVFENKGKLGEYLKSARHDQFVAECKDSFAKVRVFDTYVAPSKSSK